jgi:anti-anti-sigma regulatory factor
MEQSPITMELGEKIDISAITILKDTLDKLPIDTEIQRFDARNVTHMDSASCQLFYAYAQHLAIHNITLVFLSPSDKFMAVVKALGFETDFNYASM